MTFPVPQMKPQLSPELLARMALQNPELAAQMMASTGQAPPPGPLEVDIHALPVVQNPTPPTVGGAVAGPMASSMAGPPVSPPVPMMKPQVPAPTPTPGAGVDPNALGLALSGVQGIQQQQRPNPPPVSPQSANMPGGGLELLLQLLNRQNPTVPGLGR